MQPRMNNNRSHAHSVNSNLGAALVLMLLTAACVFFVTISLRKHILYSTLQSSGIRIKGTIVYTHSARKNKTTTYHIRYEYTAPDGSVMTDTAQASEVYYHQLSKGQQFDLLISPSDPKLNKPEFARAPSPIIIIGLGVLMMLSLYGSIKFIVLHFRTKNKQE